MKNLTSTPEELEHLLRFSQEAMALTEHPIIDFTCPQCGSTECKAVLTKGMLCEKVPVDYWYCQHCSVMFKDWQKFTQKSDLPIVDIKTYLSWTREEQERWYIQVQRDHKQWIDGKLARYNAEWILVLDRVVVYHSSTLNNYPFGEVLKIIAQQYNQAPFVFIRDRLIEEASIHTS